MPGSLHTSPLAAMLVSLTIAAPSASAASHGLVATDQGHFPDAATVVRGLVAARRHPDLAWADFGDCAEPVERFYRDRGWSTAWVARRAPTRQANAVMAALRSAERRGLDPEDYDASRWPGRVEALQRTGEPASDSEWARFDVALTVAAARYAGDLHVGRIRQGDVKWHLGRPDVGEDIGAVLGRLCSSEDVAATLAQLEPPFPAYRRTLDALERYRRLARDDDGEPLPPLRKPLERGDRYAGVARLARLLEALGDLPAERVVPEATYDGPLVEAVRRFQRRHGLEPDGRIGPETLRQLSTPISRRVRQLVLTLERWRWVPRSFAPPFVVVNIPEFRLHASDGRDQRLSMKVVVGKAYRWQTPVFAADMKQVIFRPSWTVPARMARVELAPRVEKDASFLAEDGYDVLDRSGHLVPVHDPGELAARLRSGTARLRQRPGPSNALGGVKFLLPNEHDVYLHATPSRKLFARSRRDFSHGCIRVEDPVGLAVWVLRDRPDWPVERIRAAIDGTETIRVDLAAPLPVLIVYGTAIVPESGEVAFFDDVYRHDEALERALAERRARHGARAAVP